MCFCSCILFFTVTYRACEEEKLRATFIITVLYELTLRSLYVFTLLYALLRMKCLGTILKQIHQSFEFATEQVYSLRQSQQYYLDLSYN